MIIAVTIILVAAGLIGYGIGYSRGLDYGLKVLRDLRRKIGREIDDGDELA